MISMLPTCSRDHLAIFKDTKIVTRNSQKSISNLIFSLHGEFKIFTLAFIQLSEVFNSSVDQFLEALCPTY